MIFRMNEKYLKGGMQISIFFFSWNMFLVLDCDLQLLILQFFKVHDLLLEVAPLAQSLKDHHVELRDPFLTFRDTFLHC